MALFEDPEGLQAHQHLVVDEERGRPVHADPLALLEILLHQFGVAWPLVVALEAPHVELRLFGERTQVLVAEARGLALVEQVVVLPEFTLGLGGPGGDGGVHRLPALVGEVSPFDPQRPVLDVLFVEFRFHLTGELAAERSLIVRVLGHDHGRIRRPQGRMPEFPRSVGRA